MCFAKGLTGGFLSLAATLTTDRVYEAFRGPDRSKTFFHGHSYTANPIACAAANANLQIFDTEPVFERIAAIEQIHKTRLPAFSRHSAVLDARHIGTVAAIELRVPDAGYFSNLRPRLYKFFLDRDILLRPLGNVVYVLPPYVISEAQLNFVYDAIFESLALLAA
jgi:adenosylmethionine-8-amino-7-oxononanoate aminotransferase